MATSSKRTAHNMMVKASSHILKNVRLSITGEFNKTPIQLERHLKGVANHRRIAILILIAKREGITLDQIASTLDCNMKTTGEHARRLVQAGLVKKQYIGRNVQHRLTPYGKTFYRFLKTF